MRKVKMNYDDALMPWQLRELYLINEYPFVMMLENRVRRERPALASFIYRPYDDDYELQHLGAHSREKSIARSTCSFMPRFLATSAGLNKRLCFQFPEQSMLFYRAVLVGGTESTG